MSKRWDIGRGKTKKGKPNLRSILKELQEAFAGRQLWEKVRRAQRRSRGIRNVPAPIMVKKLLDIKIKIDGDKAHQRPHVHVDYGRNHHAASYAIDSGERLAGGLDRKYDRAAREWIARNRKVLLEAWNIVMEGRSADAIVAQLGTLPKRGAPSAPQSRRQPVRGLRKKGGIRAASSGLSRGSVN